MIGRAIGHIVQPRHPVPLVDRIYKQMGLPAGYGKDTVALYAPFHEAFRNDYASAWTREGWLPADVVRTNAKLAPSTKTHSQHYLRTYAAGAVSHSGLIEPAATKLCNAEASFGVGVHVTRTTGQADLAGGTDAVLLTEDGANDAHGIYDAITYAANSTIAARVYVKRGTGSNHALLIMGGANRIYVGVDLGTASVLDSGTVGDGVLSSATAAIVGGWVEITLIGKPSVAAANGNVFVLNSEDGLYANRTYLGDSSSSIYSAHCTVTKSDYPMSAIAGNGSTRSADTLSFSSSVFGSAASEGTLFGVIKSSYHSDGAGGNVYELALDYNGAINDGAGGSVYIYTNNVGNRVDAVQYSGANSQGGMLGSAHNGETVSYAISWKAGARRVVIDGAITDTTAANYNTPANLDRLKIAGAGAQAAGSGAYPLAGVLDRYISDDEAKALTSAAVRDYVTERAGIE
ncbi:MAG: hypothetical protein GY851_03365 [bacterium]|nr:hypothetical protein [bacterium]